MTHSLKMFFASMLGILLFANQALAVELEPAGTPMRKLQRGAVNILLSPMEIAHHLVQEKDKDTLPPGWALGLGMGAVAAVGRVVVGTYELISFPVASPANYAPVVQPEFPWQYFEPAAKKAAA